MKDVVVNGISMLELKKQKEALQKGASAFIATAVKEALEMFNTLEQMSADEVDEAKALVVQIKDKLEQAQLVSGASGVAYYLPFHEEWGYDEKPLSARIDDAGEENEDGALTALSDSEEISALYGLLEDMEYDSKQWNSSSC